MRKRVPIIAVTGTKGKTTVVRVLADMLKSSAKHLLRVDTTGAYVDGECLIDLEESFNVSGLVPTVAPGKFLPLLFLKSQNPNDSIAVLEAALGSSARPGMGYKNHKVGVFTNVLEDHIGSSKRLATQQDIADAKEFIFARVDYDGWAVINADDKFVVEKSKKVPEGRDIKKIYCSLNDHGDTYSGDYVCFVRDGVVVMRLPNGKEQDCVQVGGVSWTFGGKYEPSIYNLLFVTAAYFGFFDGNVDWARYQALVSSVVLEEDGGRLTQFVTKDGVTILADYAHEKYSLRAIAELAHKLTKPNGKVIGVLRLAYDRTDDLIDDTAKFIAHDYDKYIIYDKIDGHIKLPEITDARKRFRQEIGKISETFSKALVKHGAKNVVRIIREDEALARAAEIAGPGDTVVCIVNDNIPQSIEFLKTAFNNPRRV